MYGYVYVNSECMNMSISRDKQAEEKRHREVKTGAISHRLFALASTWLDVTSTNRTIADETETVRIDFTVHLREITQCEIVCSRSRRSLLQTLLRRHIRVYCTLCTVQRIVEHCRSTVNTVYNMGYCTQFTVFACCQMPICVMYYERKNMAIAMRNSKHKIIIIITFAHTTIKNWMITKKRSAKAVSILYPYNKVIH